MAIRPVVKYPDPLLRERSRDLPDGAANRELIADMIETMYAANGAGLAAVQIGEPLRLFIVDECVAGGTQQDLPLVFVNPVLIHASGETGSRDEGCLSFPGVYLPVPRAQEVTVSATDAAGAPFQLQATALLARAIQHEMDHLDGRLIIDYVGRVKRQLITKRMKNDGK
jgi:peptide deformylase